MTVNEWWVGDPDERYWLEVTDRENVGRDLQAPSVDASGKPKWTYDLVQFVGDGDIVFHYRLQERAITAWSLASGGWWRDETVWAARGTVSRARAPYRRSGQFHGLHGPFELDRPLTAEDLQRADGRLREIASELEDEHDGSLYLPFQFRSDGLRMGQGYLFKLPRRGRHGVRRAGRGAPPLSGGTRHAPATSAAARSKGIPAR